MNGLGLYSQELSQEWRQPRHWATSLATADANQGLLLFRSSPLIGNKPHRPIPFAHNIRRVGDHHKVKIIQSKAIVASLLDMESNSHITMALGRLGSQIAGDTGTEIIAATGLKVIPANLP